MNETRLIVNADDLGLHPRIDDGIIEAADRGVVTSTSLLVSGRNAPEAARRAREAGLGIGLHLCVTSHLSPVSPLKEVRWLAPGGRFRANWAEVSVAYLAGLVPLPELETEFRAQHQRALELGVKLDHLDTHQHLHLLPGVTSLVEGLALEWGLPVRWPKDKLGFEALRHPGSAIKSVVLKTLAASKARSKVRRVLTVGIFESGRLSARRLVRLIGRLPQGVWELACHPGREPGVVPEDPEWRYAWEDELSALTSPEVKEALARRGVLLARYSSAFAS